MSDAEDNTATTPKISFEAFVRDSADQQMLRSFAMAQDVAQDVVHEGDVKTATTYLKSNASPDVLFVEIPSADEAPGLLDGLADVCASETKVIVIGEVNEYSFYKWLTDIGIAGYILKPLTQGNIESVFRQSTSSPQEASESLRSPGKVVSVIGARGGVGASTIALNLAGTIADHCKGKVAIVDVDPYFGCIALVLDIDPSRGMREALENPDRLDSLFMDRVVSKPMENLAVLSSEEALHDHIVTHERALPILMRELRSEFDYIVLDVPRSNIEFNHQCLQQADQVVLVSELSLICLRDTLRLSDLMRERLNIKSPKVVINKAGLAPKMEMKAEDFEKGINANITCKVPFAPDVYMPISSDVAAVKKKKHAATKPLLALAESMFAELKPAGGKKSFSLLKKS